MDEFVPGYESSFWTGVGAPKNTPAEIVDKLNKEINAALADPRMKARLAELHNRGRHGVTTSNDDCGDLPGRGKPRRKGRSGGGFVGQNTIGMRTL